ncbi:TetR/AcrR family transcriptional regulator [Cumulibacter soli]|uniref:TetR/AcrR family transcriptional regulator n=1 Tax=Cumulibacter soli TaxID=2546344 RepID=UPI001067DC08|nr:TetR/AcrR family transcriptional regulator [Cumulibacter soli]
MARKGLGGPTDPQGSMVVLPTDEPLAASILAAAVQVFGSRGYHGTKVSDIAAAAGVSPGSLYNYFDSKQDVLSTILQRAIDVMLAATEMAFFHADPDPASRLKAIVGAVVTTFATEPVIGRIGEIELMQVNPEDRKLIISKRQAEQRIFDRVIEDGVNRGVFKLELPRYTSLFVVSACVGVGSWFDPGGRDSVEQVVGRYQRMALSTVGYGVFEAE